MAAMVTAMALMLLLALAAADMQHETAHERADIQYRISFKTADVHPAGSTFTDAETAQREQFTSTGKFTIEITGSDGTTGPQELIDHPSQVKTDSGGWEIHPGMIQVAKITAADVGEIQEVKIEGDNDDNWKPSWIKVNSNDFHTGMGNGIFYATIANAVKKDEPAVAKVDPDEDDATSNELHQCHATFCKKAEHRYLQEGEDMDSEDMGHQAYQAKNDNGEEYVRKHGIRYGPLGEGMPGTVLHPSMTHGHFMREFFMMENVDEDDEDFLRTHTV